MRPEPDEYLQKVNNVDSIKSFDYSSFVDANKGHAVTGIDYVRAIYVNHELASDFIVWFARFLWPSFNILNDKVFVTELFDPEMFERHLSLSKNLEEAQFWMNLLEITGVFDELPSEQAWEVALIVSESWNAKIVKEFGVEYAVARHFYDEETGEVFVTIGSRS